MKGGRSYRVVFWQDLGMMEKKRFWEWNFFKWEEAIKLFILSAPRASLFCCIFCRSIRETGHLERNYTSSGGAECDLVLEGETLVQKWHQNPS